MKLKGLSEELHGLALFAGIGGIEVGLRRVLGSAYRTVCYVEREAYPAACLVARMEEAQLCEAPVWDDVATFDGKPWRGLVDILTAGYPCQPFSVAGKRRGAQDPRHLWPHVARIIDECRPAFVFLENVPGHIGSGFEQVCADLHGMGYEISAGIFSAAEVGAQHLRQRLFILAHANGNAIRKQPQAEQWRREASVVGDDRAREPVADSHRIVRNRRTDAASRCDYPGSHRLPGRRLKGDAGASSRCASLADANRAWQPQSSGARDHIGHGSCECRQGSELAYADSQRRRERQPSAAIQLGRNSIDSRGWWEAEPDVDRVVDGLSHRLDRLRTLGNAVVPATAALAFGTLLGAALGVEDGTNE